VPESRSRRRRPWTAPEASPTGPRPTPRWWVPVMLGLMLLGLVWIVVFYLSAGAQFPVPSLGAWNLAVGFGFVLAGFAMTTRWR
jgi:hypothetical protein